MWNTTDAESHSTCQKAWTSVNHRKNVLRCVYCSYHLPFRVHWNTWKTTIVPQCLVNSSKYTSRRNSSMGEKSSIFFNRSSRITIAKTLYKIQVAIFHVTKYESHISNSVHYQTLTRKPQGVQDTLKEMHFTRASLTRSSASRPTSR